MNICSYIRSVASEMTTS